jgi:hypothetical protein
MWLSGSFGDSTERGVEVMKNLGVWEAEELEAKAA